LWKVRAHPGHPDWCVDPVENLDARNEVLCFSSREDAQSLIDALATLAQAAGTKLTPPLGMWAEPEVVNDPLRHLQQSGWMVSRIVPDGPPAQAGLRRGDLIYEVNGRPCPGSGSFFSAFRQAAWPASGDSGDDVRVVFMRKGEHLSVILHYLPAAE
jgi:S1-C subfamily serine protease